MDKDLEAQVADAEEKLRSAMLASDVAALDALLAPNLIFTNHLGQRLSKEDDLSAHQSGALSISALEASDRLITTVGGNVAIVSVAVRLSGNYGGQPTGGNFRFTRVWARTEDNTWRVVAAHAGIIA